MPDCELVTAGYVAVVYVCKFCIKSSGCLECNFGFVAPGGRMGWTFSKNLTVSWWMKSQIGLILRVSCKWEMGVPLG
jgi:hypothetical protein